MALNSVSEWDATTAANNVDVGGVGIQGSSSLASGNDAIQTLMKQVAAYTRRGSDLATASTLNLDSIDTLWLDLTGTTTVTAVTLTSGHVRFCRAASAFQITAASTLIVNGSTSINYVVQAGDLLFFEGYGSSTVRVWVLGKRKPTFQLFTGSGTWTKPAGCIAVTIEAVGGGAGGGGTGGATNPGAAAAGGGGSGAYGLSDIIDVTGIASSTITIGAAGSAGSSSAGDGGVGGSTIWADGTNTLTWGGGNGGAGASKSTDVGARRGGLGGVGTTVIAYGNAGSFSTYHAAPDLAVGGHGASTPFGRGGTGALGSAGNASAGSAGTGYGAGGGGATAVDTASNNTGGAGTAGYMRVWEYY